MRDSVEHGPRIERVECGSGGAASRNAGAFVRFPGWLKVGFGICIVIAVAAVMRRMVALSTATGPKVPPELNNLDAWFRAHAFLTWVHISAALLFVLLLPFAFRRTGGKSVATEKMFFILGAITGATAYGMSRYAVGGWVERSAVLVFNTIFLLSLARAYVMQREGKAEEQRLWMTRAVAILLGIATTRPVMGLFFATERVSHLTPNQFFGMAFWIGFSINYVVIELFLLSARSRIRRER